MSKKKLKIAIFHLGFFFSGGGERLVLEEAKGLRKMGFDVDLYAPIIDKKACFPDISSKMEIKALVPQIRNLPLREFFHIIASIIVTPVTFWRFLEYDIFIAANQPGPILSLILGKLLKKPYVAYLAQPTRILYPRREDIETGYGGKIDFIIFSLVVRLAKPFIKWLDAVSIKEADAVLTNGEYISSVIRRIYKVRTINCPAGCFPKQSFVSFNPKRYQGFVKVRNTKIAKPFILLTNRHFPQKKFEYAISCFPIILKEFPGLSMVITGGKTAYTRQLEKLVKKLNLEDKIFFSGFVDEETLERLYRNAVVYQYTSSMEDFGMGVIEAMAVGTPVVAWDKAGPSKIVVSGESGFLATPFDLVDFADKSLQIIKNPDLAGKLAKGAIARAKQFSYGRHLEIFEKTIIASVDG